MEKREIKMFDMVTGVIQDGQLSIDEEDSLRKLLVERDHARGCRSLVEYIMREARKAADILADDVRERHSRLYKYCIRGSRVGDQLVGDLTEDDIRKFIIQTAVLYEMDRNSWFVFLGMLQMALNAMSREGVLGFKVPEMLQNDFSEAVKRKRCVEKPYSGDEWERIKAWFEQNRQDVRGLALALWFEGGISPEEIAGLKKSNLMDVNGRYDDENPAVVKRNTAEDYMVLNMRRKRIILDALKLYPGMEREYIFMVENNGMLEKLSKTSLQPKMVSICRQVGVDYKSFKYTDMILWGLG